MMECGAALCGGGQLHDKRKNPPRASAGRERLDVGIKLRILGGLFERGPR
jgi:hypothetical protein